MRLSSLGILLLLLESGGTMTTRFEAGRKDNFARRISQPESRLDSESFNGDIQREPAKREVTPEPAQPHVSTPETPPSPVIHQSSSEAIPKDQQSSSDAVSKEQPSSGKAGQKSGFQTAQGSQQMPDWAFEEDLMSPDDLQQLKSLIEWTGVYYRGDATPPHELKKQDGFRSRAGDDVPDRYSLYSHIEGNLGNSAYISTTQELQKGAFYAVNALLNEWNKDKTVSYIYTIEPSRITFVDVNRSIRLRRYQANFEHAAMDHIPFHRIKAWAELDKPLMEALRRSRSPENLAKIKWTVNPDYEFDGGKIAALERAQQR
ncbi:putative enterotoxin [Cordyceps sp. RAO-2017]|nr:putative enterotoxin [Cordyceps sp. RAO-2017]